MTKIWVLEDGLNVLKGGTEKARMILDGYPTSALFTCEEYMKFYDCVYDMCVQQPREYCAELYEIFKTALEESITSRVLPALMDKTDIFLLYELWNMWSKYKVMAKCLGGFFLYLDRHYAEGKKAASLSDLSVCCFRDLVFNGLYPKLLDAAISLINQDRNEKSVYRELLKNLSTFFLEMGQGKRHYYDDFEAAVLANTASYYNNLASEWLLCYSSADYIVKAEWCLSQEKERASQYLLQTSVEKLLLVVHWQLLGQTASKLQEKQNAERGDCSIPFQELLSQCAGLSLGEGSSKS